MSQKYFVPGIMKTLIATSLFTLTNFSYAAEIEKQKKCVAIVKDAKDLELGSVYSVKNRKRLVKFKVVKKTKTKAKISIGKKYCKLDLVGSEVLTSKGKPLPTKKASDDPAMFGVRSDIGMMYGFFSYADDTNIDTIGLDFSLLGMYYLNLDETRIPFGLGVNITMPSGQFSDPFGTIDISGTVTSLRFLSGFNVGGLVDRTYFSLNAGVDIGLSNDLLGRFQSPETGFPSSYSAGDGTPLPNPLDSAGDTGLGGFFNLEVTYLFDFGLELGGTAGLRYQSQTLAFAYPQPFINGSDEVILDLTSFWGLTGAVTVAYNF